MGLHFKAIRIFCELCTALNAWKSTLTESTNSLNISTLLKPRLQLLQGHLGSVVRFMQVHAHRLQQAGLVAVPSVHDKSAVFAYPSAIQRILVHKSVLTRSVRLKHDVKIVIRVLHVELYLRGPHLEKPL